MLKYTDVVTDQYGNAVSGAAISVTPVAGGSAQLYYDYAGTSPITALTSSDNGSFYFYVTAGRYNISVSSPSIVTYTLSDVFIGDVDLANQLSSAATGQGAALVGFKQSGTGAVARTALDKAQETVSVKDFGAVGDGVTDDTAAFTAAAAASLLVHVPYSSTGYKVANTVNPGSSMFLFEGAYLSTQLVGTATANQLHGISIHAGQVSGERLRLEPPKNTLTKTNEGEKRGLFINQAEPNLSSTDYGIGPWYFNELTTQWYGKRTGSGGVGSATSATVQGLRVGLDVGGTGYDLMSASALGSGLIHTNNDTSYGDKLGFNCGVYTSATSNGKVYGSSSAVTVGSTAFTPQAVGHEVDMFVNLATAAPMALGYNAWSGGTAQSNVTYAAYGIGKSGAVGAVPWVSGFCLYTANDTTGWPISTTGSLFSTDSAVSNTIANIFYLPNLTVNGDILRFPNVRLYGAGTLKLKTGYDYTDSTAPTANSLSKVMSDYEEGSYTTAAIPSTSGTITLTAGVNSVSYTKIGNRVFVSGQINVTSVSSPIGFIKINMPYTCGNYLNGNGNSCGSIFVSGVATANISDFMVSIAEGDNFASVYLGNATSISGASAQQVQAGTIIKINISYPV